MLVTGAMSAPAPVSAYLHSATMVKAGVYLLAFGNRYAISAALMFIIAHALYKAALFMVVGTVDKAAGTKEYHRLAGLGGILKMSFVAAGLSALSKAGIPPLPGFLSKEYMYKAALGVSYAQTAILVLVHSIMAALAFIIVIKPFFSSQDENSVPVKSVEKHLFLWVPPLCLAFLGLGITIFGLEWLNTALIVFASLVVNPGLEIETLKLWQGLNLPLLLSGVSLLLGAAIFGYHNRVKSLIDVVTQWLPSGSECFEVPVTLITQLLVEILSVIFLVTIIIGLAAEPFFLFADRAAMQLLDPFLYIQAVLGERP
ncbi:proton-conducting transporter membrane subunit [Desulfobacula sp.]|uniref:proton-conducting transporter transmembrane domain-containing protein n=1 Tax=Desulfobacula sp. TaxID=2593537 RepID=UPI0026096029|nr:proton-conducting transporter membrane subunit [Desulfobacula sp.]